MNINVDFEIINVIVGLNDGIIELSTLIRNINVDKIHQFINDLFVELTIPSSITRSLPAAFIQWVIMSHNTEYMTMLL